MWMLYCFTAFVILKQYSYIEDKKAAEIYNVCELWKINFLASSEDVRSRVVVASF